MELEPTPSSSALPPDSPSTGSSSNCISSHERWSKSTELYVTHNEIGDNLAQLTTSELLAKINSYAQDIRNNNKCAHLDEVLNVELEQLINTLTQIASFASDYDYKNIPANGYRTILRLFTRMLDITSQLTSKRHRMEQFATLLANLNPILLAILNLREQEMQGVPDEEAHRALLIDMFKRSSEIMKITLNGKYLSMNIPKYKWLLKIFLRLAAMAAPTASPGLRMKAGRFDENTSLFFDTILNTELSHFATYLRLLDMPFSRSVGFLLRSTVRPVSCSTKRYPKQPVPSLYQIELSATGTQLVKRERPLVKEAKFSVLQNSSPDPAHPDDLANNLGKVMIYLHGGIFLGPSADSLENLYIKDFASASRNLTLINFDYPLSPEHRFPVALELLLDFYLWLTNCHEEVEKILGFKPKQIILSGDSSGANLSAALLVLLNDIRRDVGLKIDLLELKMPSSVALFMPKMVIKLQFFPSFICTLFDPFLSAVLLLRAGELYMPIRKKDPVTGQWKLVSGPRAERKKGKSTSSEGEERTSDEDDETIHEDIPKDYVSHLEYDFVPSVYHSPLDYEHLDELSNVKLSVLSATFDPLMDESIEVVRRWPGPVSLYVVDPCFHGIYGATLIMPKTTVTLLETCNSVIRDACTLATNDHDSSNPGASH